MLVSTVLTSEKDKRISGGEAMRCKITIEDQVLMLMLDLDNLRVHPRWMFRKNSIEFSVIFYILLILFLYSLCTKVLWSYVLLEYSTII